jgi:hypothetical protein
MSREVPVLSSTYFLEKTHFRSSADASVLCLFVNRFLSAQPTAVVTPGIHEYTVRLSLAVVVLNTLFICLSVCCQFSCSLVREYTGFEVVVRLFKDAATNECIVELQCMRARGRHSFFQLFNEVADALVAAGLVKASCDLPRFGRAATFPKAALTSSLVMPEPDYSADSMAPLIAMLQSEYADVQQEAIVIFAQLVDEADAVGPASVARFIAAGVLDALLAVQKTIGAADFEARINCAHAVSLLQRAQSCES